MITINNPVKNVVIYECTEGNLISAMSPKPENTFKVVYDYLLKANRPYSTNDLFLNLHKEHGKM